MRLIKCQFFESFNMTFEMSDSKVVFFCYDMPPMTLSFRRCQLAPGSL